MSENIQNNINLINNDQNQSEQDPVMVEINRLIEIYHFDEAKILLEKKLQLDPNNADLLDTMSEVLLGLDDTENAIKAIKMSISIEPNKNGDKYMTLGQLLNNCRETLKLYEKGVTVFIDELNHENDNTRANDLRNSIASAYSSIAELYMTTELW